MWTKQQAIEYHRNWRARNREKWRQYSREAREMSAMMKKDFPIVWRKQHFESLYGDVAPNVQASEVRWNIHCPIYGIKLDYGFKQGIRPNQAILRTVNGAWEFVSLMTIPKGRKRQWREVVRAEVKPLQKDDMGAVLEK